LEAKGHDARMEREATLTSMIHPCAFEVRAKYKLKVIPFRYPVLRVRVSNPFYLCLILLAIRLSTGEEIF
jgi:hypothetical protein